MNARMHLLDAIAHNLALVRSIPEEAWHPPTDFAVQTPNGIVVSMEGTEGAPSFTGPRADEAGAVEEASAYFYAQLAKGRKARTVCLQSLIEAARLIVQDGATYATHALYRCCDDADFVTLFCAGDVRMSMQRGEGAYRYLLPLLDLWRQRGT